MYTAFHDGIFDYEKMVGIQGPIMYPAGHVYVYWLLEKLTFGGEFIPSALVMAFLHAFQTYLVAKIYERADVPGPVSLFLLLLFNEKQMAVQAL